MKKLYLAALAATGLAVPAGAAILTLEGVTANGSGDNIFTYQGTLGPDEGLRPGDRMIIFDFAGYVADSIFSSHAMLAASVENISTNVIMTPGFVDDPTIANLVFTYVGPDFRNTGGPAVSFDFDGFGARSNFVSRIAGAFFSRTVKNNGNGETNGLIFTLGSVGVPHAVPEPATWAMMIAGFGLAGAAMRRSPRRAQNPA